MREKSYNARGISGKVRLDLFLSRQDTDLSRTRIKSLIETGRITVNGETARPSRILRPGDRVRIVYPEPEPVEITPEPIALDVLYEDRHLIAVNKPPGLVVHPAAGHRSGTLVHALLHHCTELSGIGGVQRPGIVHRLDKGTSGVIVAAKDDRAHQGLARQFKEHAMSKQYRAVVYGVERPRSGVYRSSIGRHPLHRKKMASVHSGGKEAITRYRTLEDFGLLSYMELDLQTGRTHQIRVHLSESGHPVCGDPLYGGRRRLPRDADSKLAGLLKDLDRPALHAHRLRFDHPVNGEPVDLCAPIPADMQAILDRLRELKTKEGRS